MKDHEKRELVSELVGIASIAHGTEQLRDRIAYALSGVFSAIDGVTGRAEKAEAELARLREQEPAGYVLGDWRGATTISAVKSSHFNTPLYAESIPAPAVAAPAVPEEWREVMAGLVVIAEKKGKKHGSPNHCHQRPGIWDDDNGPVLSGKPCAECAIYDKARALLQSANHFVGVTEKDAARGAK